MKNILITGANGFTGSHVLESLNELSTDQYNVVAACRTKSKLPKDYTGKTLIGDLLDDFYIDELTDNADIICHTAAWAEMNGNVKNSTNYFYIPTISLINSALKKGVKRFIFLSAITSNPIIEKRLHSNRKLEDIWAHYNSVLKIEQYLESVKDQGMEVVILRVGYFTGKNYSLGLLPILLPRLKTHLVPWIKKGNTTLPLINGKDVGLAFKQSIISNLAESFSCIDIVGKEVPTMREVLVYLNKKYNYPLPHFSVSFGFAYFFARSMQLLHKIVPGDPLIVPAIVLLLEETNATNKKAEKALGFSPTVHWQESVDMQIAEMEIKQTHNMKMNK